MKTLHIKTIDKSKWKTFKQETPKVCEYIYAKDPITKATIFGKYEGGDYIYEEEGCRGKNVKFKSNWLWIYLKDYDNMEREFYENLAKVSISDLVTTLVRKVITKHLSCDADSRLFWDGRNEFGADYEDDD